MAVYSPFTATGAVAAGIHVRARFVGTCPQGAEASKRNNAYRCFRAGQSSFGILDPCFARERLPVILVCPPSPFNRTAVQVTPSNPLPVAAQIHGLTFGDPWYLRLGDGELCGFAQGATNVIARTRLNYFCNHGSLVYGDPDRSHEPWSIFYQAKDGTNLTITDITEAWF
ncbi:MAG TPA: hypothetical protein VNG13_10330 [Mycobacteriales bacterium]|nr:hypothetical protein [Mycobacteriales bacterium]